MMQKQRPLTVALPKKGRLSAQFNGLLDAAGYNLDKKSPRHDFATIHRHDPCMTDRPFQALLQKTDDALANLQEGFVDAVIAGRDKYEETSAGLFYKIGNSRGVLPRILIFPPAGWSLPGPDSLSKPRPI